MSIRRCCILAVMGALAVSAQSYRVVETIPVGGEGGWDYLTADPAAHRLYVSHAVKVVVIDLTAGKPIGEIADTPGVHGIALAPKHNRGFVSNGRANNVSVVDLATLKTLDRIATGQNPDAILYHEPTNQVFVFNGRSKDVSVIDAGAGKVVSTIPVGGKPEFAAADDKGHVFVNIEDTNEMVILDAARRAVSKRYPLAGCDEPSGLALDVAKRRLFSVCGNKVMVISDPDAGKVVATLPIGGGADGVAFDPGPGLAFSSNGDGTVTVVGEKAGKYVVIETVKTRRGARTITVDPSTHRLYLPTAELGPPQGNSRPTALPGTFCVLVVGRP